LKGENLDYQEGRKQTSKLELLEELKKILLVECAPKRLPGRRIAQYMP
jgi:hypothetical protein